MLSAAEHAKLYTVTNMDRTLSAHFGMEKITENMILDKIFERHGKNARILASPHASTTLVNLKN